MKTITVSDADYETLMNLSKELQLQPNHGQAFPYYWEPRSDKRDYDLNGEGELEIVVLGSEEYDLVELAKEEPELFGDFLSEMVEEEDLESASGADGAVTEEFRQDWIAWLCDNKDYTLYTYNMEPKSDHNPSLFLDDVKGYIEHNQHHLGSNAHTYGNTIWRMPRMEELVKVLYRINPQAEGDVCDEAWRVVGVREVDERDWLRKWWYRSDSKWYEFWYPDSGYLFGIFLGAVFLLFQQLVIL